MRIEELGFGSIWQVWATALILVVLAIAWLRDGRRRGSWIPILPASLMLLLSGALLFASSFFLREAFPERSHDPEIIHVKRVVGGWAAWTDTAYTGDAEGGKWVLASALGRDSGTLFLLESHEDEVRKYPRTFQCFNLYDSPEPQRFSDTASTAIALEIHRFDGWSGEGFPATRLHYDFTVSQRAGAYFLEGHAGGIDIGGTYSVERDSAWMPFAPRTWARPMEYR